MGHFSHCCKLSYIPITGGTKVVLFLLKMRDHWYEYSEENLRKYGTTYQCHNEATTGRFVPYGFPIRGEYDDYGGIINIERDENVEFLEEHFDLGIDNICKVLTSSRKDDGYDSDLDVVKDLEKSKYPNPVYQEKHKELLSLSGMWVHQGFYDKLIETYKIDEYGDKINLGTPAILKNFGFEYIGRDENKERYNQEYKKGPLTIYSDGTWIDGHIYRYEEFQDYCKENGVDIEIDEIISKTKAEQMYDYLLPEVREKVLELEDVTLAKQDFNRYFHLRQDRSIASMCKLFDKNGSWDMATDLGKKFILAALDGKFRKHVKEMQIFDNAMYCCGKYYDVTGTSPQDGAHEEVLRVIKAAESVLSAEVEERASYY